MIGIYKIENIINGKCYIGQSINIKRRWEIHRSELKNNTHYNQYLQKAWNKYGENNFNLLINEKPSTKPYMVEKYDLNNKLLKTYKQLKDVKQDGFLSGNVLDCCLGRKPQYKGYIWKKKVYD